MSIKYQPFHRKNKRVLAQFKPGTVERARTFVIQGIRYTYLVEVKLDESPNQVFKYMPQDIELLTNNNL